MATLGFIGTGNMGSALAKAACSVLPSDQIFLANRTPSKAQILAEELECRVTDNEAIAEAMAEADIMATAVGVNILKFIAAPFAAGVRRRMEKGIDQSFHPCRFQI